MKRAEYTEYVDGGTDKIVEADYLGVFQSQGKLKAVFVNDNGDLKVLEIDPKEPASRGDFRFL